jgi:translocation and assembly module TamB
MRAIRKILASLAALSVLLTLAGSFAWWSIHTAWFASLVRARIVAALEKTTGGRTELGAFSFDPDTLHAKIWGLVIHGTEPAGAPALLSVDSIDVGLKILSFIHRDVDVESVLIQRPRIHLIVNADGSTNVPVPQKPANKSPVEQLLALKAGRLEVAQGFAEMNGKDAPFAFKAESTELRLDYNPAGPSYGVSLDSGIINCCAEAHPYCRQRTPLSGPRRCGTLHADNEQPVFQHTAGRQDRALQTAGC